MGETTERKQDGLETVLRRAPVVPVLVVAGASAAVSVARALVAGGLPAIEITLRTAEALDAIAAVAAEVEGAIVGAGTVLSPRQLEQAQAAGARFAVSPGSAPALLDAAADCPVPLLPGAATASEAMALFDRGYRLQKFFPAEPAGGIAYLKALAAPLPAVGFCPTGGVSPDNAAGYLALGNVVCVGGSWVAPAAAVAERRWDEVERLARAASALAPEAR